MDPHDIPRRNAICLRCRVALSVGEVCDVDPEHPVAVLGQPGEREALVRAVWGAPGERDRVWAAANQAQQLAAGLGLFGLACMLYLLWVLSPHLGSMALLAAAGAVAAFWGGGNAILARVRRSFPVGAAAELPPAPALAARGEVSGESRLIAPGSGTLCVAYVLELHLELHGDDRTMLRDAVTCGFDVHLDGGRVARIPPGRLRLIGEMRQLVDVDNPQVERHLRQLDPLHRDGGRFDPLRYNVVCEQVLVPGDRVELVSPFEPTVNPAAPPTHYREPAPSLLTPCGVPIIRLLEPA